MQLISTQTLTGSVGSITFSSIPSTYTDLKVLLCLRTDVADTNSTLQSRFNGDGGANYTSLILYGNGSGTGAIPQGLGATWMNFSSCIPAANATANIFSNMSVDVLNYSGDQLKRTSGEVTRENNASSGYAAFVAHRWNSTAAINQIYFAPTAGNFVTNSTISLYGILKGSGGATVS
jgi:hypothetical protein